MENRVFSVINGDKHTAFLLELIGAFDRPLAVKKTRCLNIQSLLGKWESRHAKNQKSWHMVPFWTFLARGRHLWTFSLFWGISELVTWVRALRQAIFVGLYFFARDQALRQAFFVGLYFLRGSSFLAFFARLDFLRGV
jgi:hypothetical protein